MNIYTLYYHISAESAAHLSNIFAAAPMEVFPETFTLPIITTSRPVDVENLPYGTQAVPMALRTPFSAVTASTHLICQLQSSGLESYIQSMLAMYGGSRSMYSDVVNYPYMLMRNDPIMGRRQRGWMANMSTTLAQSSPVLSFDNPMVDVSSI